MRLLIAHNLYQLKGGEDTAVEAEAALLRSAGHEVTIRTVSNDQIQTVADRVSTFFKTPFDPAREAWIKEQVRETGAQLLHVHNFFPLLTPAIHRGAAEMDVPVVQTLHNYRLLCANSLLLRDGVVCEKCVDGSNLWGVAHRCYRGSLAGSLAVTRMQNQMRRQQNVHRYIALTEFARQKFIESGLPADRLVIKPNFSHYRKPQEPLRRKRHAAFVGRLAPEKGADVAVGAWGEIRDLPLYIAGTGPDLGRLRATAPPNVHFLGQLSHDEVMDLISTATVLIVPSICYEGFPMVVVEAFAAGTPVVASRLGSLAEIVEDGVTGLHFAPGDAKDLAAKVAGLMVDDARRAAMGERARALFEARYTSRQNLVQLEAIYREAGELAEREKTNGGLV